VCPTHALYCTVLRHAQKWTKTNLNTLMLASRSAQHLWSEHTSTPQVWSEHICRGSFLRKQKSGLTCKTIVLRRQGEQTCYRQRLESLLASQPHFYKTLAALSLCFLYKSPDVACSSSPSVLKGRETFYLGDGREGRPMRGTAANSFFRAPAVIPRFLMPAV